MTYSAIPKWTITDTNGEPVVNGTVEFFEAGTTTPKDVYSDAGRTVTAGDTLTTDALGQVGPVYLDTAAATKAVCKDSDSVTLWTVDNLTVPTGSSTTVFSQNRSVSPLDYGAIGDGAADESTEVQQAIDAAVGFVDLAGKTYRCDSALTLNEGTKIVNGTLNFANLSGGSVCISATGSIGSAVFATADIDGGDDSVTLSSTSGFTSNTWVKLSSNAVWGVVGSTKDGELARIFSIASGTSLRLDGLAIDGYTVANAAKCEQLTTVKNIAFEDVRIIGSTSGTITAIKLQYCERASFRNVTVDFFSGNGIELDTCVDCEIDGCTASNSIAGVGFAVSGTSQRIALTKCRTNEVNRGARIGNATDGACRYVTITDCCFSAGSTSGSKGTLLDQDTNMCTLANSAVRGGRLSSGDSYGVVDYGLANSVDNCNLTSHQDACILSELRVSKTPTFSANSVYPQFSYCRNTMQGAVDGVVVAPYVSTPLSGGVMKDNRVIRVGSNAFEIQATANVSDINISGNIIGHALRCLSASGANALSRISYTWNEAKSCSLGVEFDIDETSSSIDVSRNLFTQDDKTVDALTIDIDLAAGKDVNDIRINDNRIISTASLLDHAIRVHTADSGRLSDFEVCGNYISLSSQTSNVAAIEITDTRNGKVERNVITGDGLKYGILLQSASSTVSVTVKSVSVVGNEVFMNEVGADGNRGILVDVAGSSDMDRIMVSGNKVTGPSSGSGTVDLIRFDVATGRTLDNLSVSDNNIYGELSGSAGISLIGIDADSITNFLISENNVNTLATALALDNCKDGSVHGNQLRTRNTAADTTVTIDEPENIAVCGNNIKIDNVTTGSAVVLVQGTDATDVFLSGNLVSGGQHSFEETATATTRLAAIGNLFVDIGGGNRLESSGGGWDLGVASNTASDFKNGF